MIRLKYEQFVVKSTPIVSNTITPKREDLIFDSISGPGKADLAAGLFSPSNIIVLDRQSADRSAKRQPSSPRQLLSQRHRI